jgi:hypothetical protein
VKPSTKLILLVIVVTLLFVAALVMGIFMNDGGNGGRPKSVDDMKRSWPKALRGLSALFIPPIELAKLRCKEKPRQPLGAVFEQPVSAFELTEAHPACEIEIPGDRTHEYRRAELKVIGTTATVYLRAQFKEKYFPINERDKTKCFLDPPPCVSTLTCPDPEPRDAFRMEMRPVSGDADDGTWECWLKQKPNEPISVTALRGGARFMLTCVGCKSEGQRVIRMKME